MRELPEQLLQRIRLGEDNSIEFKEVTFAGGKIRGPGRNELADELAAFANGRGGTLVLGVDDKTREVVGIPEDRQDLVERYVAEVVHDAIDPPLYPDIDWYELPDTAARKRPVLRVEIPRSLFVHRSPGGYLRRVGSSKRRLQPEYLARLLQQRSQERLIRFDEQIVADASFEDLDPALVDQFRTPRTRDDRQTLAGKLAMATPDDTGELVPTVAGLLIGARNPERWLRHAFIQAVAYRGRSVSDSLRSPYYQLDARDIVGPLDVQVTDACHFVMKNQKVAARKTMGRVDVPQYDMTAVFEAVVNAVAHRDYAVRESKIRLHMFADRLELYSPGGLTNTSTVDTIEYRQASRNETVTSLLARCRIPPGIAGLDTRRETLMDRRGEGVRAILDRSEELSGRRPVYELFDDAELRLTIYSAGE
jgi:ATP-dependent DNA helicase RecG